MMNDAPMDVLLDYQNRTIVSVENLKWDNAGHTSLTADVTFEEIGTVPFTASADADTRHGEEIWTASNAGHYGPIAEFTPPTAEERRASMPPLSASQIRIALARNSMIANVPPALDAMDEPARSEAVIMWEYATSFRRDGAVIMALFDALGMSAAEADALWAEAAAI